MQGFILCILIPDETLGHDSSGDSEYNATLKDTFGASTASNDILYASTVSSDVLYRHGQGRRKRQLPPATELGGGGQTYHFAPQKS